MVGRGSNMIDEKKTAVIVGNGPSLRDVPNEWLDQYPTFGANKIHLKEGFIPTYLSVLHPACLAHPKGAAGIIELSRKVETFYTSIQALRVLDEDLLPDKRNTVATISIDSQLRGFSFDLNRGLFFGNSISYVNMQIAYQLGFRHLLCVGLDFHYGNSRRQKHFHEDYLSHVARQEYNRAHLTLDRLRDSYLMAKKVFVQAGGSIINCTPATKLDVFPVAEWRDHDPR